MNILTSILFYLMFTQSPTGYQVGETVQNFSLQNVDGKMVSLSDYNSQKGVIIVFTCNHCPYAKAYESRIMDLDNKYAQLGFPVLAINPNDPEKEPEDAPEGMIKRAMQMKYTFPYLFDGTQDIAKAFGATRTPHTFVLQNTSAGFKVAYIGSIDDNTDEPTAVTNKFVENAINALLNGNQPEINFTKAIGCTIKWKG